MNPLRNHIVLSFCFALVVFSLSAQQQTAAEKDAYTQVITKRADKIVKALNIADEQKYLRVRNIIVNQYRSLSAIHDTCDSKVNAVKKITAISDEDAKRREREVQEESGERLAMLHKEYIRKLSGELSDEDVGKVKDGMTYGVLPITYKGYLEMVPGLTNEQTQQIMAYLVEARERAMDAASSEEKHAWFGKYKGKINNYLSAAGYDLRKAGEDWQRRRDAARKN